MSALVTPPSIALLVGALGGAVVTTVPDKMPVGSPDVKLTPTVSIGMEEEPTVTESVGGGAMTLMSVVGVEPNSDVGTVGSAVVMSLTIDCMMFWLEVGMLISLLMTDCMMFWLEVGALMSLMIVCITF